MKRITRRFTPFRADRNPAQGFTLIELMVVIVILGILAGLIIPRIMGRPEEARRMKARVQIESIETAVKLYKLDTGSYPTTEQGLQALVDDPGESVSDWREGGYLEKGRVPKDPWDNDFDYFGPDVMGGGEFEVVSFGKEGDEGGEGENKDIRSGDPE